uniref:Uncharacterized protein n=1 Tax=Strigamia maritima TaxID=126957 RepID=T1JCB8_STRMM
MKLLSALFVLILLSFVCAEDGNTEQEATEKVDTPDPKQIEPPPRQTATRKQFSRPQDMREGPREGPRFRPNPQFQERPFRFQSPRQLPEQQHHHFHPSELVRRPVFIRERPQFEDGRQFHMDPMIRHVRPQQMRAIDQMRVPTTDMFSDPHSFSLPISQFKPVRVHHTPPNVKTQPQPQPQPQQFKPQKTPFKSAS